MKNLKKSIVIFVASITFMVMLSTKAQASTGTVNEETVNLRSSASTSSKILQQLDGGSKVEILGEEGDWYKVKYNSITGYISKKLVDSDESTIASNEEVTTENNEQNSETNPVEVEPIQSEQTPETEAIQSNQTTEEGSAQNEQNGDEQNNTSNSEDETEPVQTEQPTESETVAPDVKKEEIELNKKYTLTSEIEVKIVPLMNAIKSQKIEQNTEITILDSMNNWFYVEAGEKSGWVRKQTLELTLDLKEITQESEENNNNEQQESNNSEETVEENTNSVEQENQNTENNSNEQINETSNYTEYESTKTGYISGGTVNFRKTASTSGTVIKKLTRNTEVTILGETTDGWYKITVDSTEGYVSKQYVSDTKVAETTSRGSSPESTSADTTLTEPTQKDSETTSTEPIQDNTQTNTENKQEQNEVAQNPETSNTESTTTDTTSTDSSLGSQIVAEANKYLNYKYVYGAAGPDSFDCSGFTQYVYAKFGISLSRSSTAQASNGVAVSKADLQPGDLLIFNNSANTAVGHVGIYIGNNQFIHASNPSDGVKITSLSDSYYAKRYVGARRVF